MTSSDTTGLNGIIHLFIGIMIIFWILTALTGLTETTVTVLSGAFKRVIPLGVLLIAFYYRKKIYSAIKKINSLAEGAK